MTRESSPARPLTPMPHTLRSSWLRASFFGGATLALGVGIVLGAAIANAVALPVWALALGTVVYIALSLPIPIMLSWALQDLVQEAQIRSGPGMVLLGFLVAAAGAAFSLLFLGLVLLSGGRKRVRHTFAVMTDCLKPCFPR